MTTSRIYPSDGRTGFLPSVLSVAVFLRLICCPSSASREFFSRHKRRRSFDAIESIYGSGAGSAPERLRECTLSVCELHATSFGEEYIWASRKPPQPQPWLAKWTSPPNRVRVVNRICQECREFKGKRPRVEITRPLLTVLVPLPSVPCCAGSE